LRAEGVAGAVADGDEVGATFSGVLHPDAAGGVLVGDPGVAFARDVHPKCEPDAVGVDVAGADATHGHVGHAGGDVVVLSLALAGL
jgi:hypothetical protein